MAQKPKKPWIVLAACCGLATAAIGISMNTAGVFYSAVCSDLQLGRGPFSMHMTVFCLVTALFSLVVPTLLDKLPFKPLLIVSVAIATVSTGLMACGTSILHFYLLGAIRGASTCVFSSLCLTTIINRWFLEKNGLATSIVFGCTGLSGALFSPIFSACISAFGWKTGYLIMAGTVLLFSLPAIVYPFHLDPKKDHTSPYGSVTVQTAQAAGSSSSFRFSSPVFLSLCLFGILGSALTSFPQHFPGYAQTFGIAATTASMLLSCSMIGNISSKLLIGVISDHAGKIKATLLMMALNALGLLCITLGSSMPVLIGGSVLFGACYSVVAVGLPLLTRQFFGMEHYSKAFPVVTLASNVGAAVSLPVIGFIYDFSGSYQAAFLMAWVTAAICLACLLFCRKKSQA